MRARLQRRAKSRPSWPRPSSSDCEAWSTGCTASSTSDVDPGARMRFELPEAKKLTLEMVIPIRWGDMDAMGHVNNTIYFRYLEIDRSEWLHRVAGAPDPAGEGPVISTRSAIF